MKLHLPMILQKRSRKLTIPLLESLGTAGTTEPATCALGASLGSLGDLLGCLLDSLSALLGLELGESRCLLLGLLGKLGGFACCLAGLLLALADCLLQALEDGLHLQVLAASCLSCLDLPAVLQAGAKES